MEKMQCIRLETPLERISVNRKLMTIKDIQYGDKDANTNNLKSIAPAKKIEL